MARQASKSQTTLPTRPKRGRGTASKKSAGISNQRIAAYAAGIFVVLLAIIYSATRPTRQIVVEKGRPITKSASKKPVRSNRVWEIQETPDGRGKGVYATSDIKAGTLIILDTPLLKLPKSDNRTHARDLVEEQLGFLSKENQLDFLTLSVIESKLPENPDLPDIALNVFESNAVRTDDNSSGAVYKNACRINHSCQPNSDYFYRADFDALLVHALEDIQQGEEITAPYFNAAAHTYAERQAYLKEAYDFTCECRACAKSEEERAASDSRRSIIAQFKEKLVGWGDEKVESEEALASIEAALAISEEEGYHASLGSWPANAMQIAAAHSDAEAVRKWAAIALERYILETGDDSPQTKVIKMVADEPELSQAWGKRDARVLP